jgi:hypothetical protein
MRAIKKALLALTVVAGAAGFIASGPISAKAHGLSIDAPGMLGSGTTIGITAATIAATARTPPIRDIRTAIITTTATPGAAGRISQFRTACASRTLAVEPKSNSR